MVVKEETSGFAKRDDMGEYAPGPLAGTGMVVRTHE